MSYYFHVDTPNPPEPNDQFAAAENEIEYELAMTESANVVEQLTAENVALRTELAAAKSQIVELNRIIAQWHVQLMEHGE